MNIQILQLVEGARAAVGLTVVIDVFRAFSTACYFFANGAKRIIPVGEIAASDALKTLHPTYLQVGEDHGIKPAHFDYGNSPTEIEYINFSGRTLIQRSSAGTQGLVNATRADHIITGSFVNAPAIVRYIQSRAPSHVSLVCMGRETLEPSDEDTLCAQFIQSALRGQPANFAAIKTHLRAYHSAAKFFDAEKNWAPERDFDLCMDLGRFDFVLEVRPSPNEGLSMTRYDVTKSPS